MASPIYLGPTVIATKYRSEYVYVSRVISNSIYIYRCTLGLLGDWESTATLMATIPVESWSAPNTSYGELVDIAASNGSVYVLIAYFSHNAQGLSAITSIVLRVAPSGAITRVAKYWRAWGNSGENFIYGSYMHMDEFGYREVYGMYSAGGGTPAPKGPWATALCASGDEVFIRIEEADALLIYDGEGNLTDIQNVGTQYIDCIHIRTGANRQIQRPTPQSYNRSLWMNYAEGYLHMGDYVLGDYQWPHTTIIDAATGAPVTSTYDSFLGYPVGGAGKGVVAQLFDPGIVALLRRGGASAFGLLDTRGYVPNPALFSANNDGITLDSRYMYILTRNEESTRYLQVYTYRVVTHQNGPSTIELTHELTRVCPLTDILRIRHDGAFLPKPTA